MGRWICEVGGVCSCGVGVLVGGNFTWSYSVGMEARGVGWHIGAVNRIGEVSCLEVYTALLHHILDLIILRIYSGCPVAFFILQVRHMRILQAPSLKAQHSFISTRFKG